ncbi:uncharacterized protein M8220_003781 isoform 3-T14 [Acridotheres tristis]
MSYHPALLQLLGTCPCPPPVTAAQGREERKHDHFSHCRLQKWEIFFFASQHKNPISRMPVRCSLKEGDMTKGVQKQTYTPSRFANQHQEIEQRIKYNETETTITV